MKQSYEGIVPHRERKRQKIPKRSSGFQSKIRRGFSYTDYSAFKRLENLYSAANLILQITTGKPYCKDY